MWVAIGNPTATGAVTEWGAGYCSGVTVQLTDGLFFRLTSGGTLRAVNTNNSLDVSAEDIDHECSVTRRVRFFDLTETNHYIIAVHNDEIEFWINDVLVKKFKTISTSGSPAHASSQPVFARTYNSGAASAARTAILRFINVSLGEVGAFRPWSHQMAGSGGGAYQIQPGERFGPNVTRGAVASAGWPASTTARAAGTWTTTSAPATASLGVSGLAPQSQR